MRILYSFPHALGAPGIGTTALQQVLGLIRRGHQLTVIAASLHRSCPDLAPAQVLSTMMIGKARVPHRVMGQDRTMEYHDLRTARHLQRTSGYDAVHTWPGATRHTAGAAVSVGIPSLREVPNTHTANAYEVVGRLCRELGVALPKGHSHRTNARRLKREEQEYVQATALLVPSQPVLESFIDRGVPREKLLCHQYGYDPDVFTLDPPAPSDQFRAVFLGTVEPRKGLHVALDAWRRSKAFETSTFEIYGDVVEPYRPVLEEFRNLPRVHFRGFVKDTAAALHTGNALVLPSFEEGSALVTYEAQGCGLVPIVSDAAGARCVDGVTGMVHRAGDVAGLAAHFATFSAHPERLAPIRAAVEANRAKLTWAAAAERLETCYMEAIEAARNAQR